MNKLELSAKKRDLLGRKTKNLRKEGIIPANVYGKKIPSVSVSIEEKDFRQIFAKAGETNIIDLSLEKEKRPVLIHEVQTHPVTDQILHVDFLQVDLKEKIEASVPVEIVGESPAEKTGIGVLVRELFEIEVESLPLDIPDRVQVDVSALTEVDQAIYVKDLKLDPKVTVKEDMEKIVVKISAPQKEEEVIAPAAAEEVASEEEKKPEGEVSSEGEVKEEEKA